MSAIPILAAVPAAPPPPGAAPHDSNSQSGFHQLLEQASLSPASRLASSIPVTLASPASVPQDAAKPSNSHGPLNARGVATVTNTGAIQRCSIGTTLSALVKRSRPILSSPAAAVKNAHDQPAAVAPSPEIAARVATTPTPTLAVPIQPRLELAFDSFPIADSEVAAQPAALPLAQPCSPITTPSVPVHSSQLAPVSAAQAPEGAELEQPADAPAALLPSPSHGVLSGTLADLLPTSTRPLLPAPSASPSHALATAARSKVKSQSSPSSLPPITGSPAASAAGTAPVSSMQPSGAQHAALQQDAAGSNAVATPAADFAPPTQPQRHSPLPHQHSSSSPENPVAPAASSRESSEVSPSIAHAVVMPQPAPTAPPAPATAAHPASDAPTLVATPATSSPSPAHPQPQLSPHPISDPPRMVDTAQLRVAANSSELKVSVQLPDLGKVEVRAVTSHDGTTAHLTAAHQDALQVLRADRSGLEQVLKARDVLLGSMESSAQGHSDGQQRQQNSQSTAHFSGGTPSAAPAFPTSAAAEAGANAPLPDHSSISLRA